MKKHLKIFACYFKLNLASALEYRASFISQAFGMALSNSSFVFFWWVAFSQIGGFIADYSFEDVMFVWALTSTGYGLAFILFANVSQLTRLIVTSELDVFLSQPCNVLMNFICARTSLSAYGDFMYGFILMAIVYKLNLAAWLWFVYGVILCALMSTALLLATHTLTFYIGEATLLGRLANEFAINFAIYPEKIYAPALRAMMYSVIPMGIAVHIPLRLFRRFTPGMALLALCAMILYCAVAGAFFYRGLRRYESGNAIVTRL